MAAQNFDSIIHVFLLSSLDGVHRFVAMILLAFMPYYMPYLKNIARFYRKTTDTITIIQKNIKGKKDKGNFIFNAISHYITEKHISEQNDIFCEKDDVKYNERVSCDDFGATAYRIVPIYEPNTTIKIKFKDQNINIIFKRYDEEKHIILEGNRKIIKEFADFVTNMYWEHMYKAAGDDDIKMYVWEDSRGQSSFKPANIVVNKNYDNIYLKDGLVESIKQDIQTFENNKPLYNKLGIPYKRGYLFYGPPGTGKSSTVFAISNETKRNIYKLNVKTFTENDIRKAIKTIPPKSLILIEEIDVHIYSDRGNTNTNTNTTSNPQEDEKVKSKTPSKMAVSVLMDIFDGYEYLHDCIIILTTNKKDSIEPALIRPGRIDMHYYFEHVNEKDIEVIVHKLSGHKISLKTCLQISTSQLINSILLPNMNDKNKITEEIDKITQTPTPTQLSTQ